MHMIYCMIELSSYATSIGIDGYIQIVPMPIDING